MIGAEVIADSITVRGDRLLTFVVTLHRFVLAELNTHRAFTRSSASSRAIPAAKMIQRVRDNPAVPLSWPAEQRGMQGGAELSAADAGYARIWWLRASRDAAEWAETLAGYGVHKSVVNRLLEPFLWHTVIISSTTAGLDNFYLQRCSPLAQPELRAVAEAMRDAQAKSTPVEVGFGGWHLPLTTADERDEYSWEVLRRLAAARCARASYLTHDGRRDMEEDLRLFAKLRAADPPHWAPMEHPATPAGFGEQPRGNFDGWRQLRHQLGGS